MKKTNATGTGRIMALSLLVAVLSVASIGIMTDSDGSDAASRTVTDFAELKSALTDNSVTNVTIDGSFALIEAVNVTKDVSLNAGKTLTISKDKVMAISVANAKLTNNGTVVNNGSATVSGAAKVINNGTITNNGAITVNAGSDLTNNTSGTIENGAGGSITITHGTLINNGSAVNKGTIYNTNGTIDGNGTVKSVSGSKINVVFPMTASSPNMTGKFVFEHGSSLVMNVLLNLIGTGLTSALKTEPGAAVEITMSKTAGMAYRMYGGTAYINGPNQAQDLTAFAFKAGDSVTVDRGATVNVSAHMKVQLEGASKGSPAAVFTNNGTLIVDGIILNGGKIVNNGEVTNNNQINNGENAIITNNGTAITQGKVLARADVTSSLKGIINNHAGKIDGSGKLICKSGGIANTNMNNNNTFSLCKECVFEKGSRLMTHEGAYVTIGIGGLDLCPQMLIMENSKVTHTFNAAGGSVYTFDGTVMMHPLLNEGHKFSLGSKDEIIVNSGATMIVDASFVLDSAGTIKNGGTVKIDGTLNNTGRYLLKGGVTTGTVGGNVTNGYGISADNGASCTDFIPTGALASDFTISMSKSGYKLTGATVKMNGTALNSSDYTVKDNGIVLKSGLAVNGEIEILGSWTAVSGPNPEPAPEPSAGGDNTMMYIIVAIVVIAAIAGIAVFAIKRGK